MNFFCFRQLGLSAELSNTAEMTPTEHRNICAKLEFFVDRQRELCSKYDKILPVSLFLLIENKTDHVVSINIL